MRLGPTERRVGHPPAALLIYSAANICLSVTTPVSSDKTNFQVTKSHPGSGVLAPQLVRPELGFIRNSPSHRFAVSGGVANFTTTSGASSWKMRIFLLGAATMVAELISFTRLSLFNGFILPVHPGRFYFAWLLFRVPNRRTEVVKTK